MREASDHCLANTGKLNHNFSHDDPNGKFSFETFLWHQHPGFRDFIKDSPAAEIALTVMRSAKANIVFDQYLVKEPTTAQPTVWHHDLTCWPSKGKNVAAFWLALEPVTEECGSMEFVASWHLWGHRYHPIAFVDHSKFKTERSPVPDIDAMRGDCTLHHGLLQHMAGGNRSQSVRRRAYATRWAGDGVVYDPRPNIQSMLWDPPLKAGDPLDCDLWPKVWQA